MNEFSISIFTERDFPYNYVISNLMKEYNILTYNNDCIIIYNGQQFKNKCLLYNIKKLFL